jgi:hypothetical protein
MRIAIGGSRRLPVGAGTRLLVRFLAQLNPGTEILLRKGINTNPGGFELEVEEVCQLLHLPVVWCIPELTEKLSGRGAVFRRDFDMVHDADLVLAFIDVGADEYSGTAHLLEKAFEADRPVYGYLVDEHGRAQRWGENDPDEAWVDLVPMPDA